MDRLRWLAEVEISRLEELFRLPSPDDVDFSQEEEQEALREEARRVRPVRKRDR